ncbi:MAG: putative DNA binding domain-containing protein [Planctomycetia bacterium]|nr:putative DNA binding domain-containing protein [Planctomycetia bacterium]
MTKNELSERLSQQESSTLEMTAQYDRDLLARTVCSFLNSQGGTLFLGVRPDRSLVGYNISLQQVHQLRSYLAEKIKPAASWTVSDEDVDGIPILVIEVPRGGQKPYLIDGTIWIRQGAQNIHANPEHIHQIILERSKSDLRWERQPALGCELSDLDQNEIRLAANEIMSTGRLSFNDPTDIKLVLQDLSLLHFGQITNAAVILFGSKPTKLFPQAAVRVTSYSTDRTGAELPFDENIILHLFGCLRRIEELIKQKISITSRFIENQFQREDQLNFPFGAIREGIINALVHRDLSQVSGGTFIEIFPDRFSIWNAGSLPNELPSRELFREHPSLPRNPDLANVCFLRGYIEKIGRGTLLIAKELELAGFEKPRWESNASGTRLTFINRLSSRKSADSRLNERQLQLVKKLRPGEQIRLADYAKEIESTERTARSDLALLVKSGFLRRQGLGKSTFYIRTDRQANA